MATENPLVSLAGIVQGITLVTFPAASTIFLDSSACGPVKMKA